MFLGLLAFGFGVAESAAGFVTGGTVELVLGGAFTVFGAALIGQRFEAKV